jgi:hypothetical protein
MQTSKMRNSPKPVARDADASQLRAFRKAARELGADTSDERFKNALWKIARTNKQASTPKGKRG